MNNLSDFLNYYTNFADLMIIVLGCLMIILFGFLALYWNWNKKQYQKLAHQIPASVVKNYLDSIIQNSSSLKSSLFRGAGLEVSDGIPMVKPVSDLSSGGGGVSSEELNQKMALIASLESQLGERGRTISDLEGKLAQAQAAASAGGGEIVGIPEDQHQKIVAEAEALKKQLEEAKAAAAAGGGDGASSAEMDAVSKERDELKERLQEYEIIEDDLANLKRLQQENEQLKKALDAAGGTVPEAAEAPVAEAAPAEPTPEPEPAAEEAVAAVEEAPVEEAPVEEAAEPDEEAPALEASADGGDEDAPAVEDNGKSAEDLLSEFEKMLG